MRTNSKCEKVVQSIQVREKEKDNKSRKECSSRGGAAADHEEEEEPAGKKGGEQHSSEFSGAPLGAENHFLCHEPCCVRTATTRQREEGSDV